MKTDRDRIHIAGVVGVSGLCAAVVGTEVAEADVEAMEEEDEEKEEEGANDSGCSEVRTMLPVDVEDEARLEQE
ncbi:hypothetical protein SprV_0401573300 [Sparganum proliferum]